MISQLICQLGLDIGTVLKPDPAVVIDLEQKTFNVFHVPEAQGSPFVPAQADSSFPMGFVRFWGLAACCHLAISWSSLCSQRFPFLGIRLIYSKP